MLETYDQQLARVRNWGTPNTLLCWGIEETAAIAAVLAAYDERDRLVAVLLALCDKAQLLCDDIDSGNLGVEGDAMALNEKLCAAIAQAEAAGFKEINQETNRDE